MVPCKSAGPPSRKYGTTGIVQNFRHLNTKSKFYYIILILSRSGGIGRHAGFKIQWAQARGGSSPLFGTIRLATLAHGLRS